MQKCSVSPGQRHHVESIDLHRLHATRDITHKCIYTAQGALNIEHSGQLARD